MKYLQLVLMIVILIFLVFSYTYFSSQTLVALIFILLGVFIIALSIKKRGRARYPVVRKTMFLVPLLSGLILLGFGITILFPSKIISTIRSYTLGIGFLTMGTLMLIMSIYIAMGAGRKLCIDTT